MSETESPNFFVRIAVLSVKYSYKIVLREKNEKLTLLIEKTNI